MSSVSKEKSKIYETLLSSPGMNDKCKITLHISRRSILLLTRIIESGLEGGKENTDELIEMVSKDSKQELDQVIPELLIRSGLEDFYQKFKAL